jgi:hypothetical protein
MAKAQIILGQNGQMKAVIPGMSALVTTESLPSIPLVKDDSKANIGSIAKWGEDNLFPQNVIEECSKNTIIPTTLGKKAELLYAGGLYVADFTGEYDDEGNEITKPIYDKEIYDFIKRSNINRYVFEAASDLYWFFNVFPEMILSKDRKKIVALSTQEAAYCRWQKQNPNNGLVEYCYINANWTSYTNAEDDLNTKVAVIDPYYDVTTSIRESGEHKLIYPLSYPTPGKSLYQLAHWNSIRTSNWLDVAQSVPELKKYMYDNQITLKYHVQIPDSYWTWKFSDWDSKEDKEKIALIDAELTLFEKVMTGRKAAFKSFISSYEVEPQTGKEFGKWIITPLGEKNSNNTYMEDSQEASSHILFSLGYPTAFAGITPGKGLNGGGGSDVREMFNMYQEACNSHRDIVLEPLNQIRDYNGWPESRRFKIRYSRLKTADKVKPENRSISNASV